jgi:hypothetical protein
MMCVQIPFDKLFNGGQLLPTVVAQPLVVQHGTKRCRPANVIFRLSFTALYIRSPWKLAWLAGLKQMSYQACCCMACGRILNSSRNSVVVL